MSRVRWLSVVKPANGQPGGGIEFWNFTRFKININEVTVLKKRIKMVPNNTKVKLIFGDPPKLPRIVFGTILQTLLEGLDNYLLIQDAFSSQLFIVTSRHYGFDVSKISDGIMAVAIYMPKEYIFSIESTNFKSRLAYYDYAIGSLETIDDFPQEY